ncbi:MAG: sialidase family protein, partial [Acidimicrobiales bacterium]
MKLRELSGVVVMGSVAALLAAAPGPVGAQTQPSFPLAKFGPQSVTPERVTAAFHMTKEQSQPVRAFGGPTFMLADPDDPRTIVAATADLRTRICQLVVSRDAGLTWRFSKSLPSPASYPYCMDNSAGLAAASMAWGSNGTLYYSAEAFGDGEGGFRPTGGHVSQMLAKSTNLGETWTSTLIEDNRGKPEPAAATYGTSLAVDTSGSTDVVYAGYNQHFVLAPPGSPLTNGPVVVATSTDAGKTFSPAVDLNTFSKVTTTIGGQSYPLLFEGFFGSPLVFAREGTVLAVSGAQIPNGSLPAGQTSNFAASFTYPMPQLIGRSTDQGKTWTVAQLGPPIFSGSGSQTGMGWTPKGGPNGTYVVAYQGTPATSSSSGPAQILVQRSTDDGITWSEPVAIDQPDGAKTTAFYPQIGVAPNGRIDVVWQDDLNRSDFRFNVRYTYSTDGGLTWAPNILVSDRPLDFNYGVSFNSDLRQPPGVASTDEYAAIGWADTRLADELTQTQDNFGAT